MEMNQAIAVEMARRIEMWPIDRLRPYERNARTHSDEQIAQIAASIIEFGFVNPILVDSRDGIVAGHGRLLAARKLHLSEVPVVILDHLTEVQRRAYILADNKLAENAGWDEGLLSAELAALRADGFNLDIVGFTDEELAGLLGSLDDAAPGLTDEDAVPDVPTSPINKPGDQWNLGNHRLRCGDATVPADRVALMAGDTADLVFTDPPYNVDYEGYTDEKLKIKSDCMPAAEFKSFLQRSFRGYRDSVKAGASMYVCHPSSWQREFQDALEAAGFAVRCQIIWAKNTFAWGFGRYKFQHEPLFYCHVAGQSDPWYGDRSQSTLWQEKKPAANRLHPTMKPVELIERALANSSKAGDVVLDCFGGSGSTLIACERLNRKARLMEIDPRYADVIIRRWQEFTGREAVHESTGMRFNEHAEHPEEVTR
jgi:DNA modification methylase